jgi:hypothetical protein
MSGHGAGLALPDLVPFFDDYAKTFDNSEVWSDKQNVEAGQNAPLKKKRKGY